MSPKQEAYAAQAQTILKNLKKRGMEGYYFSDSESCVNYILDMIPEGSTVTNGGSATNQEIGIMEAISSGKYQFIDRFAPKTPAEQREAYARIVSADYFFMSTNAITLDGELINIDGAGNRVACLIHGPEHVMIVAGMNKVVSDVDSGISRVHNMAAVPNVMRLNKKTPCHETGVCANCLSPDCICNHTVITRHNGTPGRIKIFLIGEELGF